MYLYAYNTSYIYTCVQYVACTYIWYTYHKGWIVVDQILMCCWWAPHWVICFETGWLVVWNMNGLWFSIQLAISSSQLTFTDEFSKGVGIPPAGWCSLHQDCSIPLSVKPVAPVSAINGGCSQRSGSYMLSNPSNPFLMFKTRKPWFFIGNFHIPLDHFGGVYPLVN